MGEWRDQDVEDMLNDLDSLLEGLSVKDAIELCETLEYGVKARIAGLKDDLGD